MSEFNALIGLGKGRAQDSMTDTLSVMSKGSMVRRPSAASRGMCCTRRIKCFALLSLHRSNKGVLRVETSSRGNICHGIIKVVT